MKRFTYILVFTYCFLVCSIGLAQREKIDSLKKALPTLKDSARIDCLNALSEVYINTQIDTAEIFDLQALEEAKKINYIHGMAEAVSLKATVVFNKYNNYSEAVNLAREAILLYAKTSNKKRLNRTYYELGHALYAQSYFKEAINNFNISYDLSTKARDTLYVFYSVTNSAYAYLEGGDYKNAFEKVLYLHQLILKYNNVGWKIYELSLISDLYYSIEDYNTALAYVRQAFQISKPNYTDFIGIAELFSFNQQFDSAKYYYSLVDTSINTRALRFYLVSIGTYYFLQGKYDKALPNFLRGLSYHKLVNDRNQVMRTLVNVAKTHLALQNNDSAFKYAEEALALAQQTGARQFIRDCYQILYTVYGYWQQADSAFFYHVRYMAIKDSITSAQVAAKLVAYNFDQKIEVLNKEKEVKDIQLQKQSLVRNILGGSIIILLVLAAIIFRNIILKRRNERQRLEHELELQKLESEKTKAELQQQATELEMQALRAQMNPHFIFNSLNSINRFILQNNKAQASEYLTKFSKLIRLILQNSQAALIPLESELEALKLYLELEAVRFDHQFEYKIIIDNDLDADLLKVPPLIIQPYAENAIWHGLMHKEEKGHLEIELFQCDKVLCCKITDDGIGRQKAAELKSKSASTHKSMGMRITADRIAMLQQKKQIDTTIKITDLVLPDGSVGGTEVLLKIPVML